jgi:hypothetical protein
MAREACRVASGRDLLWTVGVAQRFAAVVVARLAAVVGRCVVLCRPGCRRRWWRCGRRGGLSGRRGGCLVFVEL